MLIVHAFCALAGPSPPRPLRTEAQVLTQEALDGADS